MIIDDFILRALIAGILVAVAAGPLGCFVVWRRMAYFGDATAHAAILGVALALAFDVSVFAGTLATALAMAVIVAALAGRGWAMDTTLGVLAHSALALGLVAVSFLPGVRVDLTAYLFGDILTVTTADLWVMAAGAGLVLGLLIWRWEGLLTTTISEDLALSLGMNPARERLILTLALAVNLLGDWLRDALNMATYFCDAYASWQKGGIENANGRLRRWLPRQTNLDDVSDEDIQEIVMTYNLTPRKCLGYKTPLQALFSERGKDVRLSFA